MRAAEFVSEKWSAKYKRSIDCSHPRGFSQRAHCQGRKKNEDANGPVEAWGYAYNRRDQRVVWRREFSSSEAAYSWAESKNATVVGVRPLQQLDELTFKGSPCTKDCSGHRAGYEWSRRKGGVDAASWSPSFNNGAALFKNGY